MLEFTLLVLPTEINASGTVKSVKSASICLDCISLCNKILSKLGHAVVVEDHHPGTDFAWYALEFEGNQVGIKFRQPPLSFSIRRSRLSMSNFISVPWNLRPHNNGICTIRATSWGVVFLRLPLQCWATRKSSSSSNNLILLLTLDRSRV